MKTAILITAACLLLLSSCVSSGQLEAVPAGAAPAARHEAPAHPVPAAGQDGLAGNIVMDAYDQQQLFQIYEKSPSGKPTSWTNPKSGIQYKVTPRPPYWGADNQWCRTVDVVAVMGRNIETTLSAACRRMDGSWQPQQ